jgi:branched-chain amino acid transport system ATP-binding protein
MPTAPVLPQLKGTVMAAMGGAPPPRPAGEDDDGHGGGTAAAVATPVAAKAPTPRAAERPAPQRQELAPGTKSLLEVRDLHAWYGESHILHGVSFEVREGEVVTLLGRNGAGKTTTLRSIMGMVRKRQGSIQLAGKETIGLPSNRIARLGIALCPEERGIFASLNVRENLMLPPQVQPGGMSLQHIFELFPNIKERLASQGTKLSGGEQQMLAVARILRTGARLLMLDEPTEGLAPVIVQQIGRTIRELKQRGFTVLLVEQNFRFAATVADRHYVVEHGQVVDLIENADIRREEAKLHEYLGV